MSSSAELSYGDFDGVFTGTISSRLLALLAATIDEELNLPKGTDLWVPNPNFTGMTGSFTGMTAFITEVRLITGLMRLALARMHFGEPLDLGVVRSNPNSDRLKRTYQACECNWQRVLSASLVARMKRFGLRPRIRSPKDFVGPRAQHTSGVRAPTSAYRARRTDRSACASCRSAMEIHPLALRNYEMLRWA